MGQYRLLPIILYIYLLWWAVKIQQPLTSTPLPQTADSWRFPLDPQYTRQSVKYEMVVENTNYGVRNLDLLLGASNITCFDLGAHRIYHAGVDFYNSNGSAAGLPVYAIANGQITHVEFGYPGYVFIISHTLPNNDVVYSMYGHVETQAPLDIGTFVDKGTVLGVVTDLPYHGNFPEFHPDGDDSHLHFEIRTFADATTVGFPADCVDGFFKVPGPGYTFPYPPNHYGYLDPIAFILDHQEQNLPQKIYLPLVTRNDAVPLCQNDQNLIQNIGFEFGSLTDPEPWLEVSTMGASGFPLVP